MPSTDPESKVWGMAYKISEQDKQDVLKHLDFREQNGYSRHKIRFYPFPVIKPESNEPVNILIYLATNQNESFAGESSDISEIGNQILTASGKSGPNREYIYKLATAMRSLFPGQEDDHLFELEEYLLQKEKLEDKIC